MSCKHAASIIIAMKKIHFAFLVVLFAAVGCSKSIEDRFSHANTGEFTDYIIARGEHSSDKSGFQPVSTNELNFIVKFDNSAIYETVATENQYDINKLYGFSDNDAEHQQYSARLGWNWNNNALHIFAYCYNNSVRIEREITTIQIGQEVSCSIKVSGNSYVFNVNGVTTSMPREATTATGKGYKLYPYFGGDETAPHEIKISIKEV